MPVPVTLHVFDGNRLELLPAMCMFCGQPLVEERFRQVPVHVGNTNTGHLWLPICCRFRLGAEEMLFPDGRNRTLDQMSGLGGAAGLAVGFAAYLARQKEGLEARFTFENAHGRFAAELERLRNLTADEYDDLMTKANEAFTARMLGAPVSGKEPAEENALFDVGASSRMSEMSVEVVRANSRKMMLVWILAGLIALTLMMCFAVALLSYTYLNREPRIPAEELAKKKKPAAPKEMKARIKNIDRNQSTMRLLVGDGKYQTFNITPETEFRDADDRPLPQGIDAPEVREEENAVIFPTEDRQGLQWLKLAR